MKFINIAPAYIRGWMGGVGWGGWWQKLKQRSKMTQISPQPNWRSPLVPLQQSWIYMVGKKHSEKADQLTLASGGSEHV